MKIFFDTEFQEYTTGLIRPISFGFVREDGECLYRIIENISESDLNEWVRIHVGRHLDWTPERKTQGADVHSMRREIVEFCGDSPELWADYSAFDCVVLSQFFGTMIYLPKGWPMFVRDFQQHLEHVMIWSEKRQMLAGDKEPASRLMTIQEVREFLNNKGPQQDPTTLHHALHDARHLKAQFDFIQARV